MKYIKSFDGLRGISIIMVFVTHLGYLDQFDGNDFWVKRLLKIFSGTTGVEIFFVLSGFLITKILFEEKTSHGFINIKNFFYRRFLRLMPPLILFYLTVFILMALRLIPVSVVGLSFAFFYIYNFVPNRYYTQELGHIWSLAVEEQFYFVWPFIVAFFSTFRTILISLAILILCIVAIYILPNISVYVGLKPYLLSNTFKVDRFFFPAVAPIIIGSLTFLLTHHRPLVNKVFSFGYLKLIALFLFFSPLVLPDLMLDLVFIIQSIGIALLLVCLSRQQDDNISYVLSAKPLSYIGKISYGLYVYHGLFIRTGPGGGLLIQKFPINLLITLALSIVSYEFLEKRILKLKNNFR